MITLLISGTQCQCSNGKVISGSAYIRSSALPGVTQGLSPHSIFTARPFLSSPAQSCWCWPPSCPLGPHLPDKSFLFRSQAVFKTRNAEDTVSHCHAIVEQLSLARRRNSTALSSWKGNEQRRLQVPEFSSDGNSTRFCIPRCLPSCPAYVEISFIR